MNPYKKHPAKILLTISNYLMINVFYNMLRALGLWGIAFLFESIE